MLSCGESGSLFFPDGAGSFLQQVIIQDEHEPQNTFLKQSVQSQFIFIFTSYSLNLLNNIWQPIPGSSFSVLSFSSVTYFPGLTFCSLHHNNSGNFFFVQTILSPISSVPLQMCLTLIKNYENSNLLLTTPFLLVCVPG